MNAENENKKNHGLERNTIVIVDDDDDLLKMLVYAFEAEGFKVQGLATGKEALAYLKEEKNLDTIRLLVLDRVLPDMEGLDILNQLVDKLKNRIPVLVLSVLGAEKDVVFGLKHGAIDYVTKPFSLPILMEKSLTLISRYP